jgi:hypothetical protein
VKQSASTMTFLVLMITWAFAGPGTPVLSAGSPRTVAQQVGNAAVTVAPARGTIDTSFSIVGSGFAPGSLMDEAFTDPEGAQWQFSDWNMFNVEDDGTFGFTYNLGQTSDPASLPRGSWTVSYCYDGTNACSTVAFVIE